MTDIFDNQITKIVIAPHYDDFVLFLGGTALKWEELKCPIENWIIFSNSNFILNDPIGNLDVSKKRIKKVTQIRYNEELRAMHQISNIRIKRHALNEALLRGYNNNTLYSLNKKIDHQTIKYLHHIINPLLIQDNIQVFAPLAIKTHVDHSIVRNILTYLFVTDTLKRKLFFYEDFTYYKYADKSDIKKMNNFITRNKLQSFNIPINKRAKLEILHSYPSQLNEDHFLAVKSEEKIYTFMT